MVSTCPDLRSYVHPCRTTNSHSTHREHSQSEHGPYLCKSYIYDNLKRTCSHNDVLYSYTRPIRPGLVNHRRLNLPPRLPHAAYQRSGPTQFQLERDSPCLLRDHLALLRVHARRLRVHRRDLLRVREADVPVARRRLRARPVLPVPRDRLLVLLDRRRRDVAPERVAVAARRLRRRGFGRAPERRLGAWGQGPDGFVVLGARKGRSVQGGKRKEGETHVAAALAVDGVHVLALALVAHDFLVLEADAIIALWVEFVERVDGLLAGSTMYASDWLLPGRNIGRPTATPLRNAPDP